MGRDWEGGRAGCPRLRDCVPALKAALTPAVPKAAADVGD